MRHVPGLVGRSVVAVAVALALSGCLNTEPQTSSTDQLQTTSGANVDTGALQVRNLVVHVGPDGNALVTGAVYNAGTESDRIAAVTVNGASTTTTGDVALRAETQTLLGPTGVQIATPAASLEPGLVTKVVMSFDSAPEVSAEVLVQSAADVAANTQS